jgi:hypothetical protein
MSKSLLNRKVKERLPNYLPLGRGQFVRKEFEHVLSGYVFESTPSGVWIWRLVYPLFYRVPQQTHLLYSQRLPGDLAHLSVLDYPRDRMPDEFIDRVIEYEDTAPQVASLSDFCLYCESDDPLKRSPYGALALGYAYTLAENLRRASECLSRIGSSEPPANEAAAMLSLLRVNPADARSKILAFELTKKMELGLM